MTELAQRTYVVKPSRWVGPFQTFELVIQLFYQTIQEMFRFPWRGQEIAQAIVQIGVGSLPIISVSTAFAGLVVTQEIAWHMDQALHTVSMIPGFTGQFIFRELGIAMPALLLVSKVGAAMAAEIGTMKVTDQIEALKQLKINTVTYLIFPRWIATIISLVCLTLISIGITLGCAVLIATTRYSFSALEYITALRHFITYRDLFCAIAKSMTFGAVIPIICCAYGLRTQQGAQGVGMATTQAVVSSTMTIIVLDFALTYVFSLFL